MMERSVLRSGSSRRRLVALVVTAVMLAGLAPLTTPGTARAVVLDPPTLVTPAVGDIVTGNPVFEWPAVSGAVKYRIELSTSASFSPSVSGLPVTTTNLRYAPPAELPIALTPAPTNSPTTSTLNFPVGDNRANGVPVALSGTGTLSATYMGSVGGATTDLIFDVTGYFVP